VRPLRLRIDRLVIDIDDAATGERMEVTLRAALELLARRLAGVPLGKPQTVISRALATLELEPIAPDVLLGPGGAARLADELYGRVLESIAT
jgi:hypothetical protein